MKTFLTLSKTIAFHAATSNVELGNAGERLAIALFSDNGYRAYKQKSRYMGDIAVICPKTGEINKVEVKIAKESLYRPNAWNFCLNKQGFTSSSYSDFCLFFVVMRGGVGAYLVPERFIGNRKSFTITNPKTYKGMLKKFEIEPNKVSFDLQREILELSV